MTVISIVDVKSSEASEAKLGLVSKLQEMLLQAQEGRLTEMVCLCVIDDNFIISRAVCSKLHAISYATMMQDEFLNSMRLS